MQPILLITRPEQQGRAFAKEVAHACDRPFDVILSPALDVIPLTINIDTAKLDVFIFTSANGVAQSKNMAGIKGKTAWCVGDQTALAAQNAGFQAISVNGDANILVNAIAKSPNPGAIAHIRGVHAHGNITKSLGNRGIFCADIIAYDQKLRALNQTANNALQAKRPIIAPIFSARSAQIFHNAANITAPLHIIAISSVVREIITVPFTTMTIAAQPNGATMVKTTSDVINTISPSA